MRNSTWNADTGEYQYENTHMTHDQTLATNKKNSLPFLQQTHFSNSWEMRVRCGLPGAARGTRTHLRQQRRERTRLRRATREKNFTHGDRRCAAAPGPGDIFLFFPSACHSWQVQLRIESSCPMRRSVSDSARPGQVRLGSASLPLRVSAGLLARGR